MAGSAAEAVEASVFVAPWVSVAFDRVATLDGVVGLFPWWKRAVWTASVAGIGISTGPTARHAVEGTARGGKATGTLRRRCGEIGLVQAWKLHSRWINIDIFICSLNIVGSDRCSLFFSW